MFKRNCFQLKCVNFINAFLFSLKKSILLILIVLKKIKTQKYFLCVIQEIDVQQQKAIIYCKGTRINIHLDFVDIINDLGFICNFSPIHACWIGYYYGKHWQQNIKNQKIKSKQPKWHLQFNQGKYKILSQDRDAHILYQNIKTKEIKKETCINIAKNEYLIMNFDQTQACYIGMLAGIESVKNINFTHEFIIHKKPALTLIK